MFWLASVAALASHGDGVMFGLVAVLLVAFDAFTPRPALRALIGACAAAALVRTNLPGGLATGPVVAALALAPAAASAWQHTTSRRRRQVLAGGTALLIAAVAATAFGAFVSLRAASRADDAVALARAGLESLRQGDRQRSASQLQAAAAGFEDAWSTTTARLTLPARAVPVVGWQVRAVGTVLDDGRDVSEATSSVAGRYDENMLIAPDGGVDLAVAREIAPVLADLSESIARARDRIDALRSPWLAGPVRERLDEVRNELERAYEDSTTIALTAELLPELLGGDKPKTWLVLLTNPAEARGFGGLVGNWATVVTEGGRLRPLDSGRAAELNIALRASTEPFDAPIDYLTRYGPFGPQYRFQDLAYSPDFPTDAEVARTLYARATGTLVDGVISVDPSGIAALLDVLGPVRIPGYATSLSESNVVDFIHKDQYTAFATNDDRVDALVDLAGQITSILSSRKLPAPRALGNALSPMARGRHLAVWTPPGRADRLWRRLDVDGRFAPTATDDILSVVAQNAANNKTDPYLERVVAYRVSPDPATGRVSGQVRVEITNRTPITGLPAAVTGSNDRGLPVGVSRLFLTLYTNLDVRSATLDGRPVQLRPGSELGFGTWTVEPNLDIPAGETRVLSVELDGAIPALASTGSYRLLVVPQTVAGRAEQRVTVDLPQQLNASFSERLTDSARRSYQIATSEETQ